MSHQQKLDAFYKALEESDLPAERRAAAKELVERLRAGERLAAVLKDLAGPLGLTADHLLKHLVPVPDGPAH
ncbi:hypothetical protein [Alloalcanivorax marinus]|uniref:hypothetical protein n=1 Tax=Alloalcanivorax marinus TaxID=1177169 RepID=UPI0021D1B018|nr:hypothetical protein [Alloalcanivorax marinus]MCU5785933.1 hypothetical protein [Alloalcanivorax marinus]